jgi:hypothetical protein
MNHRIWLPLFLPFLVAACGGGEETAESVETADGTAETAETAGGEQAAGEQDEIMAMVQELVVPPEQPWSEMSHEDRGTDMVMRFEPVFRVIFEAHDAEAYDHFDCASCHGEAAAEREYAMPAPDLPPVPPANSDAYREMAEAQPEVTRFMEEEVTPTMQTMLGVGATFGCNGCHPTAAAGEVAENGSAAF